MRLPKLNLRREPKDLNNLKMKYQNKKYFKRRDILKEAERVNNVIETITEWIGEKNTANQGQGTHFIFPLTSALGHGEFVKGVLRVVAPKAKVTFLVTAKHTKYSSQLIVNSEAANSNLEKHLSKSVGTESKRIIIVDDTAHGRTRQAIRTALKKQGFYKKGGQCLDYPNYNIGDFISNFFGEEGNSKRSLGWRKENYGEYAADPGNFNRKIDAGDKRPQSPARNKQYQRQTKISNERRRYLFNLGIATAKTYLKQNN